MTKMMTKRLNVPIIRVAERSAVADQGEAIMTYTVWGAVGGRHHEITEEERIKR